MKKKILTVLLAVALTVGYVIPVSGSGTYTVREGDVLWRIARDHGTTWEALAEYNGLRNPHLIRTGQEIRIPDASALEIPATAPIETAHGPTEQEVTIGAGTPWPLGGTLTLPAVVSVANPVPAVVLVHGSGPNDRDLTLGVNRAFYDIASYLTANGIAVLRYDKRTFTHGAALAEKFDVNEAGMLASNFTYWEETIEDAVLAAGLLRADARIDSARIYMAGLSLGGMLAPRIHASGGDFAGIIIMAGSPRHILEITVEQERESVTFQSQILEGQIALLEMLLATKDYDTLRMLDPALQDLDDETALHFIEASLEEAYAIKILLEESDGMFDLLLSTLDILPHITAEDALQGSVGAWPAYILRDMAIHSAERYLAETSVPMLIMQGENDKQILADVDYLLYKELLGGRENVTFRLYPGLNHIFMPCEADTLHDAFTAMLGVPAQVHPQVLQDMVDWITSRPS
ncbi:MAG: alpha/beta fold hydrolase [Defluviitaleaceae bacterium]|nr:alpha/beta fold hydrolase [Defluviitaleaceae bacterium]